MKEGKSRKYQDDRGLNARDRKHLNKIMMQADFKAALSRIMVLGSSVAVGFGAASMEALQPNFSFHISMMTLVAFALGFILLHIYWRILLHPSEAPAQKRLRFIASCFLACGGVAGFLYPLRFIAPSNHKEVAAGLLMALCAALGVAALLLLCKRFLDEDARSNDDR